MNRSTSVFGTHPALYAFLLGGGAFLASYFGYSVFVPSKDTEIRAMDSDLFTSLKWGLFILGVLMWLTGGIIFGRSRKLHWFVSLCLQLLPVIGLILMAVLRRRLTPHEAWAMDNPDMDEKTARRTFKPMKPLY